MDILRPMCDRYRHEQTPPPLLRCKVGQIWMFIFLLQCVRMPNMRSLGHIWRAAEAEESNSVNHSSIGGETPPGSDDLIPACQQ